MRSLLQKATAIFFIASVISPVCHSQGQALKPDTFPVSEGQSLEINCNATGSSNVVIWWAKNQTGSSFVSIGPVLRFETTNRSDAGEYLCYSNSTLHNDMTLLNKAKVYVLYRPEIDQSYGFPRTTIPARLGELNVTLEVHIAAEPTCKYDWKKRTPWDLAGGNSYVYFDNYSTKTVIANITLDNYDKYDLKITNSEGAIQLTFSVIPTGPPEAPSQLRVVNVTHDTASLSFFAGYDYGSNQSFSVFTDSTRKIDEFPYSADGHGRKTLVRTVENLEPNTLYNITVQASSRAGQSPNSNSVVCQTRHKPVSAASGLHAGTLDGSVSLRLGIIALLSLLLR